MSTRAEPAARPPVRLLPWGLAYTPAAALALLLPKCPLCIAAQLALLGVTIPLPGHTRAIAVAASVVLGTLVILARARRGAPAKIATHGCCSARADSLARTPRGA